jgi:predicted DNA-binding ribbon-helix-helix protein
MKNSPVIKRSIDVGGHKTSISLEDDFWRALKAIALRHRITVSNLFGSTSYRAMLLEGNAAVPTRPIKRHCIMISRAR